MSVRAPFVSWTVEGDDLLRQAGQRAEDEERRRQRARSIGAVASLLAGLAALVAALGADDDPAFGGAGVAAAGAILATSSVILILAATRLFEAQLRRRGTERIRSAPNLEQFERRLIHERRVLVELEGTPHRGDSDE